MVHVQDYGRSHETFADVINVLFGGFSICLLVGVLGFKFSWFRARLQIRNPDDKITDSTVYTGVYRQTLDPDMLLDYEKLPAETKYSSPLSKSTPDLTLTANNTTGKHNTINDETTIEQSKSEINFDDVINEFNKKALNDMTSVNSSEKKIQNFNNEEKLTLQEYLLETSSPVLKADKKYKPVDDMSIPVQTFSKSAITLERPELYEDEPQDYTDAATSIFLSSNN